MEFRKPYLVPIEDYKNMKEARIKNPMSLEIGSRVVHMSKIYRHPDWVANMDVLVSGIVNYSNCIVSSLVYLKRDGVLFKEKGITLSYDGMVVDRALKPGIVAGDSHYILANQGYLIDSMDEESYSLPGLLKNIDQPVLV